jgi:hypothetical protein
MRQINHVIARVMPCNWIIRQIDIILYLLYEFSFNKMNDKKNESRFIASVSHSLEHESDLLMSARALALKDHFAARNEFNIKPEVNKHQGNNDSEHGF